MKGAAGGDLVVVADPVDRCVRVGWLDADDDGWSFELSLEEASWLSSALSGRVAEALSDGYVVSEHDRTIIEVLRAAAARGAVHREV